MAIRKDLRRYTHWLVVTVYHPCGCCHSNVFFKNEENMRRAEANVPRCSHSGEITDDLGRHVDTIDTFCGGSYKLVKDLGDEESVENLCETMDKVLKGKSDRDVGHMVDDMDEGTSGKRKRK